MSKSNNYPSQGVFCTNYLLLKPEEASLTDLLHLLYSNENRNFIHCPQEFVEELQEFRYRWLVFISVIMLKLLRLIKLPMAHMGYSVNFWLNLISNNGGLLKLLMNYLKGKVEFPEESNDAYRSTVANLDPRVDLDPTISFHDTKYDPALAWMAAKLSYENSASIKTAVEQHWKMTLLGTYDFWNEFQKNNSTHALMFHNAMGDKDQIVVAFKGTDPFNTDDWCTDLDISWFRLNDVGRVHAGFMKALGLQMTNNVIGWPKQIDLSPNKPQVAYYTIREALREIAQKNKNARFIITGHSLGGALAILFVSILILHEEWELIAMLDSVYTFGQPRVGDEQFGEFVKESLKACNVNYCRYVYCNDMVPRLPYDDKTLLFKHFGSCHFYDSFYNGKQMPEEPNKNYFSLIWAVSKYLNSWWELLRGFIFPYWKWGPNYTEGWCQRVYRIIGCLIPGLSAHGPQDYTNLTRLGSISVCHHDDHNQKYD